MLFISFLCFLSFLSASTCVQFGDQHLNAETKHILQKRSAVENSSPTTESSSSAPSGTNGSGKSSQVALQQDQKLLGVNGTGQRKDLLGATTASAVLGPTISTTPLKGYSTSDDQLVVDIDVPEDDINKQINESNIERREEYHQYYNSTILTDKEACEKHRAELGNFTVSTMLSHSYRRAMTIKLSFDFPFYGHKVRNVTVATGGFLYTGDHVHSWLAATQYIAPLMANFDTSQSNDSFVKHSDNGTAFTVLWENVKLQDNEKNGTFTFSATLYSTGDITFAYYSVPVSVEAIMSDKHPVKVGLSDAYIIDKTIFFARRKTIYEYHRVNFDNPGHIGNNTLIHLFALETCLSYTDCQACVNAHSDMSCLWCTSLNRCSTGTDRRRQEWMHKGCDQTKITKTGICPKIGEKGNDFYSSTDEPEFFVPQSPTTETPVVDKSNSATQSSRINTRKMNLDDHDANVPVGAEEHHDDSHGKNVKATLGFLIPIGVILTAVLWAFYAYRNPHSKSGQFLIQYRPSQWGWRRGEAHYTAAVQQ